MCRSDTTPGPNTSWGGKGSFAYMSYSHSITEGSEGRSLEAGTAGEGKPWGMLISALLQVTVFSVCFLILSMTTSPGVKPSQYALRPYPIPVIINQESTLAGRVPTACPNGGIFSSDVSFPFCPPPYTPSPQLILACVKMTKKSNQQY